MTLSTALWLPIMAVTALAIFVTYDFAQWIRTLRRSRLVRKEIQGMTQWLSDKDRAMTPAERTAYYWGEALRTRTPANDARREAQATAAADRRDAARKAMTFSQTQEYEAIAAALARAHHKPRPPTEAEQSAYNDRARQMQVDYNDSFDRAADQHRELLLRLHSRGTRRVN